MRALSRYHCGCIPTSCTWAAGPNASTTSPAESTYRRCSAATPTGAARSGFPINYLLIESLQKFHHYFGDDFTVECPTGSGQFMTLWRGRRGALAGACRRSSCATPRAGGPSTARMSCSDGDPHWRDHVLFYEYFHGDNGRGPRRQPSDRLDGPGRASCCSRRARNAPAAARTTVPNSGSASRSTLVVDRSPLLLPTHAYPISRFPHFQIKKGRCLRNEPNE